MTTITLHLNHKVLHIQLPEGVVADPKLLSGGHPLMYVIKQKAATENYLNRVAELLNGVKVDTVVEFCGGIGLIPLTLNDVVFWKIWTTVELDPACEKVYACPEATFVLGNMYDPIDLSPADLVFCDFPNNTLPKMWREDKRAELLRRIADAKPRYWEITDVGYYWIHLANHWPIYEKQFGVKPTRQNYHELFDRFMRENYGYKVVKWTVGGGAQYFLMEAI